MASNNLVMLQGNMTKPEVRSTQSGKTITSARMVIKTYGDKDDMWVTVKMWGALGENLNESFPADKNTMRVQVAGRLTEEKWKGQDGNEKTQMTVTADSVSAMLDWQTVSGVAYKGDGSAQESNTYTGQGVTAAREILGAVDKPAEPVARTDYGEDEAPF
tara:strand:+ start:4189 stop:4668 length:480 start_codon:yes stop_codon:yes gene_type:complete